MTDSHWPPYLARTDDQRLTWVEDNSATVEHRSVSGQQTRAGRVVADVDVDWWEVTWNADGDPKKPRVGYGDSLRDAIDHAMDQDAVESFG